MASRTVTVGQGVGLHARPAAQFVQAATRSNSTVTVSKGDAEPVSAASILKVISLDVRAGDEVVLTAEGDDAEQTLETLAELVSRDDA